jgi:hypothetical protein
MEFLLSQQPPTEAEIHQEKAKYSNQLKKQRIARHVLMAAAIALSFGAFISSPLCEPPPGSPFFVLGLLKPYSLFLALLAAAGFLTCIRLTDSIAISRRLSSGLDKISPDKCEDVLAYCQSYPVAEQYRRAVIAHRMLTQGEGEAIVDAAIKHKQAEACKALHDVGYPQ